MLQPVEASVHAGPALLQRGEELVCDGQAFVQRNEAFLRHGQAFVQRGQELVWNTQGIEFKGFSRFRSQNRSDPLSETPNPTH